MGTREPAVGDARTHADHEGVGRSRRARGARPGASAVARGLQLVGERVADPAPDIRCRRQRRAALRCLAQVEVRAPVNAAVVPADPVAIIVELRDPNNAKNAAIASVTAPVTLTGTG